MQRPHSILKALFWFVKEACNRAKKRFSPRLTALAAGVAVFAAVLFASEDSSAVKSHKMVAFAEMHIEQSATKQNREGVRSPAPDRQNRQPKDMVPSEETTSVPNPADVIKAENNDNPPATDAAGTYGNMPDKADPLKSAEDSPEPETEPEIREASVSCSDQDYNTLLRIVQAESGGCDLKGRILIANVILNRVESDEFPDTISDVVYQKHQFSPVNNGSINTCKVSDMTVEAVNRALAGEDYSEGALYFMNRKESSPKNVRWFDRSLEYLFQHEKHEFFR